MSPRTGRCRLFVAIFLLLNLNAKASASLKNVAAAVGQPMSMKCSVHQPNTNSSIVAWTIVSTGSKTQIPIWSKGVGFYENFTRSAVVSNSSDSMKQFQIRSMDFHFAGIHTCAVISAPHNNPKQVTEILYTAHVIVLDDTINGSASFTGSVLREGESFEVSCSIRYRGNWPPAIEWRQHHKEDILAIDTTLFNCSTNQTSSFVASGLRSLANYMMNNTTFSCRVYFTNYTEEINTSAKTTTARNIPDFNRTWVSPRISITASRRDDQKTVRLTVVVSATVVILVVLIIILIIVLILFIKNCRNTVVIQERTNKVADEESSSASASHERSRKPAGYEQMEPRGGASQRINYMQLDLNQQLQPEDDADEHSADGSERPEAASVAADADATAADNSDVDDSLEEPTYTRVQRKHRRHQQQYENIEL